MSGSAKEKVQETPSRPVDKGGLKELRQLLRQVREIVPKRGYRIAHPFARTRPSEVTSQR